MQKYNNPSSGIIQYEIGSDYILIEFKGNKQYLYNYKVTGKDIVEEMKKLAKSGKGLSAFIHKHAKTNYIKK